MFLISSDFINCELASTQIFFFDRIFQDLQEYFVYHIIFCKTIKLVSIIKIYSENI